MPIIKGIYDAGSDMDGWLPQEFRKYVRDENLLCRGSILSSILFFLVFEKKHKLTPDLHIDHRGLVDKLILLLEKHSFLPRKCLVQFWRAEEVVNNVDDFGERRFLFTTRNQPFIFRDFSGSKPFSENICSYRMKTHDVIITGDGGVIGRVFLSNRLEYTPDVEYYSSEEYPHRDMALSCNIKSSLMVPLSDSNGRTIGVIEYVSPHWVLPCFLNDLFVLLGRGLICLDRYKGLCGQYVREGGSLHSDKIKEVMEVVGGNFELIFAQTWMLRKLCNSLSTSGRCAYEPFCNWQKGEGIVNKATAMSHNLVYCEDVAKFSITEYPLAHIARRYNLSACFAICLQPIHCGDQVFVLEFFPCLSYVKGKDLREMIVPILDTIRHNFPAFKVVSGREELGDSLCIQIVDANFPDKFETLEIGALDSIDNHTTETSLIDDGENMVNMTEERDVAITLLDKQHHSSAISGDKRGGNLPSGISNAVFLQQVVHIDDFDTRNGENMICDIDDRDVALASLGKQLNNAQNSCNERIRESDISTISQLPLVEENVVYTEANVLGTSGECIINSSKSPYRRGGIDISLEELMGVIGLKRKDAAKMLDVSESTFKRVCREYDILRWPPRKRNVDHQSCSSNSIQTTSTKELGGTFPTVQNESLVTIKAKYGDKFIKFQLSASSGIDAFHHQVSKRLKLEARNYTVNYQDEDNDWIIIACNDDLRHYISSSTLLGKNTVVVFLEHI